ncbi:MAG: Gfo/Idh/MocA family oxidoreductase [Kiritimatiellae bacterium]|nr:Gfo/Idh/MocA family oxidoreductase [Kiritimatiellia bacterium]
MVQNRREFLKGTAWMGLAAMAGGCVSRGMKITGGTGGLMQGYADKPMETVRVGFVGLGSRGPSSARRLAVLPGVRIVALCDYAPERVAEANAWRVQNGHPKAREYSGPEGYKRMCEAGDIDVIYSVTSWESHTPINCYAMEHGKHVFTEMPGALTVEDCWKQVETSERTRRHCMMLENCCYGEYEMLALNMIRLGLFGEIVHGEGGYVHDQRGLGHMMPADDPAKTRIHNFKLAPAVGPTPAIANIYGKYHGNWYPTHGLGPVARCMNINHGDRFEYLVSLESKQACLEAYGKGKYGPDSWQGQAKIVKGDMNSSLIRTAMGKSILLQHDIMSPRPYSRLNVLTGTRGEFRSFPKLMFTYEEKFGDGASHSYFDEKKTEELRVKYRHPLWKVAGEIAKKVGGHGGMDFVMDLRWSYCLRNGLPLDTDVYDMASWSCLVELTRLSVERRSASIDIPDFTRGAWQCAKPFAPETFDVKKLGLEGARDAGEQQKV